VGRDRSHRRDGRLITGGLLTRYVGWEYIFFLNVPVGVAALALAPRMVPESRLETARRRYDPLGALTVTGGLLLLVYAISTAPADGWAAAKTIGSLAVSGALLVAFVLVEARVEAPPLRMLRMRTVTGANAAAFLLGGSFYAFIFIGTLYMQQVLGYSALKTGLAWLAASLTSVALAGLSQLLVIRIGPAPILATGMAMIAGGTVWAAQVAVRGQFWADLAGAFFIAGAGTAFAFIPISIAGLTGVAEQDAGLASGLLNTAQQLGGAIGVAIASTVAAQPRTDAGYRGPAAERGAHRRIPLGVLGVHRDRRARGSDRSCRPAPPHRAAPAAGHRTRRGVPERGVRVAEVAHTTPARPGRVDHILMTMVGDRPVGGAAAHLPCALRHRRTVVIACDAKEGLDEATDGAGSARHRVVAARIVATPARVASSVGARAATPPSRLPAHCGLLAVPLDYAPMATVDMGRGRTREPWTADPGAAAGGDHGLAGSRAPMSSPRDRFPGAARNRKTRAMDSGEPSYLHLQTRRKEGTHDYHNCGQVGLGDRGQSRHRPSAG
jgi:predicted MFS family arabinose efflux permease